MDDALIITHIREDLHIQICKGYVMSSLLLEVRDRNLGIYTFYSGSGEFLNEYAEMVVGANLRTNTKRMKEWRIWQKIWRRDD